MKHLYSLLLCIGLLLSITANATVYYVNAEQGNDSDNGTSWATATKTILTAYGKAAAGDEIWVAAGDYETTIISVNKNLAFYGGFAGTETSIDDRERIPGGNQWDFKNISFVHNPNERVFHITAGTVTIDGFTVTGAGSALPSPQNADQGGAIAVSNGGSAGSGTGIIRNCIVENSGNEKINGAGIFLRGSVGSVIEHCLIENNTCNGWGGGVYLHRGTIRYCIIRNNRGNGGGGIMTGNDSGGATIHNCLISGNTAGDGGSDGKGGGGGVLFYYDKNTHTETLYNCVITGNQAGYGSGINFGQNNDDWRKSVYNVTIAGNKSTVANGGGVYLNSTGRTLSNAILYNNYYTGDNTVLNKAGGGTLTLANGIIDRTDYANLTANNCIINSNPTELFKDITNYVTASTFPGINKGTSVSAGDKDLAGNPRTVGGTIDIGPYEIQFCASTNSLDFGNQKLGVASELQTLTISKSTALPGIITYTTPDGYEIIPDDGNWNNETGGDLNIVFTPTSAKAYNDAIAFTAPGADGFSVSLTGAGAAALITTDKETLTFEETQVGEESEAQTLTVTGENLTENIAFDIPQGYNVTKDAGWDNLEGGTLSVRFAPTAATDYDAQLVLKGAPAPDKAVSLKGLGVQPELTVDPQAINWDEGVVINELSPIKTATITAAHLKGDVSYAITGSEASDFEVTHISEYSAPPLADTFVSGRSTELQPQGDSIFISVKKDDVDYNRDAFLKFSIADLDKFAGVTDETPGKITLTLYLLSTNNEVRLTKWLLKPVTGVWSETDLKLSNVSGLTIGETIAEVNGFQLDSDPKNPDNVVIFDITEYVLEQYASGKRELSFNIINAERTTNGQNDSKFFSKEYPNTSKHPKLSIQRLKTLGASVTIPAFSGTQELGIRFKRATAGTSTATINLTTTGDQATLALSGTAILAPTLSASVTTLAFGDIQLGKASEAQTLTVTGENLTTDIELVVPEGYIVTKADGWNDRTGGTLSVQFRPLILKSDYSAKLVLKAAHVPDVEVDLTGAGIMANPYGEHTLVAIGGTSTGVNRIIDFNSPLTTTEAWTIVATTTYKGKAVDTTWGSRLFSATASNINKLEFYQRPSTNAGDNPGITMFQSKPFSEPLTIDTENGTLFHFELISDGSGKIYATETVNGKTWSQVVTDITSVPLIIASSHYDTYVTITQGAKAIYCPTPSLAFNADGVALVTKNIEVTGIGATGETFTYAITGTGADAFSIAESSGVDATSNVKNTVTIRFVPPTDGTYNAEFTISGGGEGVTPRVIPLTGTAVNVPILSADKEALTFEEKIQVGEESEAQTLTVTGVNLTADIELVVPEGYDVTEGEGWNARTGGTLSVQFKPLAVKNYDAKLVLRSASALDVEVSLTGVGVLNPYGEHTLPVSPSANTIIKFSPALQKTEAWTIVAETTYKGEVSDSPWGSRLFSASPENVNRLEFYQRPGNGVTNLANAEFTEPLTIDTENGTLFHFEIISDGSGKIYATETVNGKTWSKVVTDVTEVEYIMSRSHYETTVAITRGAKAIYCPTPSVAFNAVGVATATKNIEVSGFGATSGTFTYAITGDDAAVFSIAENSGVDATPGVKNTVTIQFAPTANNTYNAVLTISGGGEGVTPRVIPLTGTAVNLPVLLVAPATVNWEETVHIGDSSAVETVTITAAHLKGDVSYAITGHAGDFVVTLVSESGSEILDATATLPAFSGTQSLSIYFKPAATGTREATISLTTEGTEGVVTQTIQLSGTAEEVPALSVDKEALTFEDTQVGEISATQILTVTGVNLKTDIELVVPEGYTVTKAEGWDNRTGGTLSIQFTPLAAQAYDAKLVLTAAPVSNVEVSLTGLGIQPELTIAPATINWEETVHIGDSSAVETVTITAAHLKGDVSYAITGHAGDFVVTLVSESVFEILDATATLPAFSGTQELNIYFKPAAIGTREATISLTTAGVVEQTIQLSGTADKLSGLTTVNGNDPVIKTSYYNLQGVEIDYPERKGVYLLKRTHASQNVTITKVIFNK